MCKEIIQVVEDPPTERDLQFPTVADSVANVICHEADKVVEDPTEVVEDTTEVVEDTTEVVEDADDVIWLEAAEVVKDYDTIEQLLSTLCLSIAAEQNI